MPPPLQLAFLPEYCGKANLNCSLSPPHAPGETWNLMKIGYQLKQVRERLAKGLVDKGILRTEKRNFLLFDMATHPVADGGAKEELRRRVRNVLTQRTVVLNDSQFLPETLEFRYLRTVCMVCAAYAANVLENALSTLGHEARERAFAQTDELLADYSQWPFGKKATTNGIGANLPQVISEVRRYNMLAGGCVPKRMNLRTENKANMKKTGGWQGQRQGTATRGRGRVLERIHAPRLASVDLSRRPRTKTLIPRCHPRPAQPRRHSGRHGCSFIWPRV